MSADLDKFERAIDRAVREMLDVEPPADLRANVIARIGDRPASGVRLPAFGFQRMAALAAAAALLVLVLVLARRPEPLVQAPVVARAGDQVLPAPRTNAPEPPRVGRSEHALIPVHPTAARPDTAVATMVEGPDHATTEIEPLKTITPIHVTPIGERSIAPESIAVRPLDPITDVQVAPLTPPDRRN